MRAGIEQCVASLTDGGSRLHIRGVQALSTTGSSIRTGWVNPEYLATHAASSLRPVSVRGSPIDDYRSTRVGATSFNPGKYVSDLRVVFPDNAVAGVQHQLDHVVDISALKGCRVELDEHAKCATLIHLPLGMGGTESRLDHQLSLLGRLRCVRLDAAATPSESSPRLRDWLTGHDKFRYQMFADEVTKHFPDTGRKPAARGVTTVGGQRTPVGWRGHAGSAPW
jgi:hypothetical protein